MEEYFRRCVEETERASRTIGEWGAAGWWVAFELRPSVIVKRDSLHDIGSEIGFECTAEVGGYGSRYLGVIDLSDEVVGGRRAALNAFDRWPGRAGFTGLGRGGGLESDDQLSLRSGLRGASTLVGGRLLRGFEKLFEYESIVALEIARSKDERHRGMFRGEFAKLDDGCGGFGGTEFFEVARPEFIPLIGTRVVPMAKPVRGSEIAEPCGKSGTGLGDSARPEAIDEDTCAIRRSGWIVGALDLNAHRL